MPNLIASLFVVLGVMLAVVGGFLLSVPAGLVTLGAAFVVVGYLGADE
jgi:hypothetical protein